MSIKPSHKGFYKNLVKPYSSILFLGLFASCAPNVNSFSPFNNSSSEAPVEESLPLCTAGTPFEIRFLDGPNETADAISTWRFKDQLVQSVRTAIFDDCGSFI